MDIPRTEREIATRLEIIGGLYERAKAAVANVDTTTPEGAKAYLLMIELGGALQALNWVIYDSEEMSVLQRVGHLVNPK